MDIFAIKLDTLFRSLVSLCSQWREADASEVLQRVIQ